MLLRYFYDKNLAQASYMVACTRTGEALVIDPMRDIQPYLEMAAAEGIQITHVTETHIHADFVSGSRELVVHTGARLYLSNEGGSDWQYAYADENTVLLHDGDSWLVGNIKIEVIHTPGHTPEQIAFMVTDTVGADKPMGVFTGDFLFVGDVGRPDLLEKVAEITGTMEIGARQQFKNLQRFKALPDYLQIWPGHGAGSACGKALGAVPSTTLGYEKLFNPAFQYDDEQAFVTWLLSDQPEPPYYFSRMKHVNKIGTQLLQSITPPQCLDSAALRQLLAQDAQVFDFRLRDEFAATHIPKTLNIPFDSRYTTYIGWFVDFENPLYMIVPDEDVLLMLLAAMRHIGVDHVAGYFLFNELDGADSHLKCVDVEHLPADDFVLLDVRNSTEYQEKHVASAIHIPLGYLPEHIHLVPPDKPVVVHCVSGVRSQIAASLLMRLGFNNIISLNDDFINLYNYLKIN